MPVEWSKATRKNLSFMVVCKRTINRNLFSLLALNGGICTPLLLHRWAIDSRLARVISYIIILT